MSVDVRNLRWVLAKRARLTATEVAQGYLEAARKEFSSLMERAEKAESERDALLEVLRLILKWEEHEFALSEDLIQRARAAIAKATGEQR